MKCMISVTPIQGKPSIKEVTLKGSPNVKDALDKAGISAGKEFAIYVGGKPANLGTLLTDNANISLTEKVAGS